MKQTDKVLIVILSIWTFIHCFLLLKGLNYKNPLRYSISEGGIHSTYFFNKADRFYPFTNVVLNEKTVYSDYNFVFYDYTEFFVYVVGAWGLFFIYKFLFQKK
jgi:hypothetical protein